jgi:hypothetical protein
MNGAPRSALREVRVIGSELFVFKERRAHENWRSPSNRFYYTVPDSWLCTEGGEPKDNFYRFHLFTQETGCFIGFIRLVFACIEKR